MVEITKEATVMMNNAFYFYFFIKGCPSFVTTNA